MDARRYRMVVTSRTDYVRTGALVDEQLRHWLAHPPKRYNVDAFVEGRNEIARGVTLDHDSVTGVTGAYGRWRLRETAPGGTWLLEGFAEDPRFGRPGNEGRVGVGPGPASGSSVRFLLVPLINDLERVNE